MAIIAESHHAFAVVKLHPDLLLQKIPSTSPDARVALKAYPGSADGRISVIELMEGEVDIKPVSWTAVRVIHASDEVLAEELLIPHNFGTKTSGANTKKAHLNRVETSFYDKRLMIAYIHGNVPSEVITLFEAEFNMSLDTALSRIRHEDKKQS